MKKQLQDKHMHIVSEFFSHRSARYVERIFIECYDVVRTYSSPSHQPATHCSL